MTQQDNDIGRLANLLGAYAERLRRLNNELDVIFRRRSFVTMRFILGTILIIVLVSLYTYYIILDLMELELMHIFILTLILIGYSVYCIYIYFNIHSDIKIKKKEIEIARRQLVSLTRLVSQYNEHVKVSQIAKLEIKLRLSEAEESLKLTEKYAADDKEIIETKPLFPIQSENA